nr:MAG TPA: zinc-ribbon containing domain protein [Caudoviricetes sp.]
MPYQFNYIFLHTKDTESHEDSGFCYDVGGTNMTSCLNCGMLILDSEVDSCPYCKLLLAQTQKRNVPESQSDKAETAIFENVVFNKGEGWKNV